ncbi:MAG: TraR/DksA C4-type zinc finger protein [Firmicutes bacterium]|nr:TraR/DksA C4-type zinc finger protein [Bacillota bacterium]
METPFIRHKLQLEQLKRDLLEQTEFTEGIQEHEGLRDSTQELSVVDNHPADIASENYERAKDISLHEKNLLVLEQVNEALKKVEVGSFGVCENCGKPIIEERLDAVPYATYCLDCKKQAEAAELDLPRPIEELSLVSPFARTYMGDKDYTGYDGEDAWQDVDQYNKLPHVFERETADESDETIGAVEDTDRISNDEYKRQLPD